jgi:hypothetical protein
MTSLNSKLSFYGFESIQKNFNVLLSNILLNYADNEHAFRIALLFKTNLLR